MSIADDQFFSQLSEASRDCIRAAEIEAESILASSQTTADQYAAAANLSGIDRVLSEVPLEWELARDELAEGTMRAALHLWKETTRQWWELLKPDVQAFMVRAEGSWQRALRKFGLDTKMPEDLKRLLRALVLRLRAAAAKPSRKAKPRGRKPADKGQRGRPHALEIEGKAVKGIRGERSQAEFARSVGISVDVLQRAEGGEATEKTVTKLCNLAKRHGYLLSRKTLETHQKNRPPKTA